MKSLWSGGKGEFNTYICNGFITIISILCVFTYFLYIALLCKRYSTKYCIGRVAYRIFVGGGKHSCTQRAPSRGVWGHVPQKNFGF